ncbi:MAG: hypothetical protein WD000_01265, partial [Thermodesulfobacteriota bacterium]
MLNSVTSSFSSKRTLPKTMKPHSENRRIQFSVTAQKASIIKTSWEKKQKQQGTTQYCFYVIVHLSPPQYRINTMTFPLVTGPVKSRGIWQN